MTYDAIHMKKHHKEFLESLTPEELEIHNRPDVRDAQKGMGKIMKAELKKMMKRKKKGME